MSPNSTIGGAGAGNQATDNGGGIYNYAGTTTVDGSTVISNTAEHGGGIWNRATLNVQNGSTIGGSGAGNQATERAAASTTIPAPRRWMAAPSAPTSPTALGGGIFNKATLTCPERQHHRRGWRGQPGRRWRRHIQRYRHDDGGWQHRQRQHSPVRRRHLQQGYADRPEWQHHRRGRRGQHRPISAAAYSTMPARRRWMAAPSAPTRPSTAAVSTTWPR